jgi:hypothetical protein
MKKVALSVASALAFTGFLAAAPIPAFAAPVVPTAGAEFCILFFCFPISPVGPGGGSAPRGAPGPIAGAGLPFLALGAGAYWLYHRRRKSA